MSHAQHTNVMFACCIMTVVAAWVKASSVAGLISDRERSVSLSLLFLANLQPRKPRGRATPMSNYEQIRANIRPTEANQPSYLILPHPVAADLSSGAAQRRVGQVSFLVFKSTGGGVCSSWGVGSSPPPQGMLLKGKEQRLRLSGGRVKRARASQNDNARPAEAAGMGAEIAAA